MPKPTPNVLFRKANPTFGSLRALRFRCEEEMKKKQKQAINFYSEHSADVRYVMRTEEIPMLATAVISPKHHRNGLKLKEIFWI